jgi:hypothetical protein
VATPWPASRHRRNPRPAASALTDNGSVYTSRFTYGHNDFERPPARLGIAQKNGHPGIVATMLR